MADFEQFQFGETGLKESQITEDDFEFASAMDEYPPGTNIDLNLFTPETDGSEKDQARTTHVGEKDIPIMEAQSKNYRIRIQRLLWIDGKYHSKNKKNEDETKEATFVVLKFYIRSLVGGDRKPIRKFSAQLDFGAKDGNGSEAGWNGNSIGQSFAKNSSRSWKKTYFDEYSSSGVSVGTRQCGVCWDMTQNSIENHGVTPGFLVYVLLTRSFNATYLAKFTMNVTSGHIGGAMEEMHLSWLKEKKSAFFVTPDTTGPIICVGEGEAIRNKIRVENLELLKSKEVSTGLRLPWEEEEGQEEGGKEIQKDKVEIGQGGGEVKREGGQQKNDGQWKEWRKSAAPGDRQNDWREKNSMQMEKCNLAADLVDNHIHSKLVMLETRMALLEHRFALQDRTISQLRQELQHASMAH